MSAAAGERGGGHCVLLHGWGMGASACDRLGRRLTAQRTLDCPDLPGCGRRRAEGQGPETLGAIADDLLGRVGRPAHWIGWSLGGLVALAAAARAPSAVERVTLLAASPRMVAGADWPGIEPAALDAFRAGLARDPAGVHARFLALQVQGSESPRPTLRALRAAAAADGLPGTTTLARGLGLLADSDLRGALSALSCPVDAVLGEQDALVPAAVAESLERLGVSASVIAGAGHAPLLSHPGAVADALLE